MANAERSEERSSGTVLLLATNAVLAGLAWYASTMPIATEPVTPALPNAMADRVAPPIAQSLNIPAPPDAAELATTRERPLFRADRRLYEPKPAPPPPAAAAPSPAAPAPTSAPPSSPPLAQISLPTDLRLVGIVAAAGQRRAVFRVGDQRESIFVVAGERIGDWRVAEIRLESVVLVAGSQREVLELFAAAKKLGTVVRR